MKLLPPSLLAALLVLSPQAGALTADRNQPMDVAADYTDAVLSDDGSALLRGNVEISQGSLKVRAAEATLTRHDGAISKAVLRGQPATVEQQLDAGGTMRATAAQIEYDLGADVLLLTGNVHIDQPEGSLRGESVRYHIANGRIEGGTPGSRVQMRIPPRQASAPND
ncbi:MAG: lipopolysaccharide transport periplasmic protein LptA [Xanthomonadales bacterium]|nr:lipopolysaccharide transport periplasmic protein LptA [Xanthomonadales bacterium]